MTPFQIVGLALLAVLALLALIGLVRGRQRWSSLSWLLVWAGAATAIYRPNLTRDVAQLVGIDRGADLVSYLTTLLLLVVIFLMSARMRRFESHITLLTRELALARAERSADEAIGSSAPRVRHRK